MIVGQKRDADAPLEESDFVQMSGSEQLMMQSKTPKVIKGTT